VWNVSDEVRGEVRSTSISQPPVLASVVKLLLEQGESDPQESERVRAYLPKLLAYHIWWYRDRDPENTGLVVSYHPWESGMDNSPAWDDALAAVPPVEWQYQRRDTQHVDSSERPKQAEYDRYLYLVDFFIKQDFDAQRIYDNCPFKVQDLGIISILHRASKDLLALCDALDFRSDDVLQLSVEIARTEAAIDQLWSEPHQSFLTKNLINNQFCEVQTTGTLLAFFAGLASQEQAEKMANLLSDWLASSDYGVASTYPKHPTYEPQRYWRGPVWLHINWMIAVGLKEYQFDELHQQVVATSKALIEKAGYWEYFNADTGKGCGGDLFSWTAAISLYWLIEPESK
jgi:neutral trehalase